MKLLILDIETAPNTAFVWGLWGQNIGINQIAEPGYTLCWAAMWENERQLHFRSSFADGDADMLYHIWQLLDEADAVITYNGQKFDLPTLNSEFARIGFGPPSPYKHIDLYKVMKKNFKLPSFKLDFVLQYFGIGAKVQHKGMPLWIGCMQGDEVCWKQMERYNKGDVRPLKRLYKHLLPWIKDHPNYALYNDTDRPVCTNCGSKNVQKRGVEHTKTQSYQRFKCTKCGTNLRGRTTVLDKDKRSHVLTQA